MARRSNQSILNEINPEYLLERLMLKLKLLHAVTKTQYSQIINTSILKSVFKSLLLGRKAMANLNSILKSRDITLSMKVCLVKTVVFPVVMYGCESWTIKLSAEELMLF